MKKENCSKKKKDNTKNYEKLIRKINRTEKNRLRSR